MRGQRAQAMSPFGRVLRSSLACVAAAGSIVLAVGGCTGVEAPPEQARGQESALAYEHRVGTPRVGSGKFYMGREIARPVSAQTVDWMERPARAEKQRPDLLVQQLALEPTDVVADVGAGSGYFTFRLSPLVPEGKVLAVDVQQAMLDLIEAKKSEQGTTNVETVLGTATDPRLGDESVDLILMVDAYHEFSHPIEMMQGLARALKRDGVIVLVEYRAEDPEVPIHPIHKMSQAQARREMEAAGLVWRETRDILPQQHLMLFAKP